MLRKKKILTAALCAGGVVLSAALTAAETETTIVSQPFAKATNDLTQLGGDKPGTWEGYGSVTNQSVGTGYAKSVGKPIAAATDKLYLSVDGSVTCTAATTENKPATVDMMIQISRPDEALALPTGETTDGIQIALGVETNGTLKAYCTDKTTAKVDWYSLGKATYAEGEWHRVSFTFDYGNGTCQIRLDGEPLMTEHGALTSDGTGGTTGSWYKLNTTKKKNLSSVKVVGSTAIDEVVIKQADSGKVTDVLPALADIGGSTGSVPNQWIAEQGITRAQAAAPTLPDDSGMSALEKYQTGLPVGDGKTYVITAMAMAGEAGNVEVTLTVPKMTPPKGRQNVVVWGTSPDKMEKRVELETNAAAVELTVPVDGASGVTKVYYQLKNEPVAQQ